MLIVAAPPLHPGKCAISGTSVGPMIDTLVDFDTQPMDGRIYIAVSTVEHMAEMIGMASELAHDRAKGRVKKLEAELRETQQHLAAERELNQALINARADKEPVHVT